MMNKAMNDSACEYLAELSNKSYTDKQIGKLEARISAIEEYLEINYDTKPRYIKRFGTENAGIRKKVN